MRGLLSWLLLTAALLVASCSSADGPSADPLTTVEAGGRTPARPTFAPVAPPPTIVIEAALPERVPMPGEPSSYPDGPGEAAPNTGRIGEVRVTLPEDYLDRPDVGICVHSDDLGWHGCSIAGLSAQILNTSEKFVSIVLIDLGGAGPVSPLRRLALLSVTDARDIEWRVVDGYETLADLLTRPMPSDGTYLEPIP